MDLSKISASTEANVIGKRSSYFARILFAGVALGCTMWSEGAVAQYPNRLIKLIVPYVAGGPSDMVARAIADKLSISLKQPLVIENRPGAGGNIGTDVVAKAAPDGHTLGLVVNTTLTVNPSLYKNMPFDADRDITPVSIVGTGGQILIVHPSMPVRSVTEFVAFAKSAAAKKEPIAYASAGNGTASHLTMEYFRLHAGFEAIHVPYRSVAPLVVDLLAGQVKLAFVGTSVIVDHVQASRLNGLGVSHDSRAPLVPDVPTIAESGYPGFKIETFSILLAPAGLPEPIARILEREVQAALKLPDMAERFRLMDTVPVGLIGPEVRERIKVDRDVWSKVLAAANLRLD
jgi:tripartite-type tricarboxylate transporter receptor subunit TctC